MSSSLFTMARKSAPECLPVSQSTQALHPETCNPVGLSNAAESGEDRLLTGPSHTTRHAGPHRAVHEQSAHEFLMHARWLCVIRASVSFLIRKGE